MRSVIFLLGFAALGLPSSWLFAQADAQRLCTQYAEDSGLAEEEIADYVADCVTNLGGEDSLPDPSVDTDRGGAGDSDTDVGASETAREYAADEGASESTAETDSGEEQSESADEHDSDGEISESAEEYPAVGETSESMGEYRADETTADETMHSVGDGEEVVDEYASDAGADESKTGPTSPFGDVR